MFCYMSCVFFIYKLSFVTAHFIIEMYVPHLLYIISMRFITSIKLKGSSVMLGLDLKMNASEELHRNLKMSSNSPTE